MKFKVIFSLFFLIICLGCSSSNNISESHLTPTAPTILVQGVKDKKINNYLYNYICEESTFNSITDLISSSNDNYVQLWNDTLRNATNTSEIKVEPILYQTLQLCSRLTQANQSINLFDSKDIFINDFQFLDSPYMIHLNSSQSPTFPLSLNKAINITLIKQKLHEFKDSVYLLGYSDNETYNALIPATYLYYEYIIKSNQSDLRFQYNEPYSIEKIYLNNEDVNAIYLVSENPIAIELLKNYIYDCTYDQFELVKKSIEEITPVYCIYDLTENSKLKLNIKHSVDSHNYTWDKELDHLIRPI